MFGGCNFTRSIVDLLTAAGFTINELDVFYQKGAPKFTGADSLGTAAERSMRPVSYPCLITALPASSWTGITGAKG